MCRLTNFVFSEDACRLKSCLHVRSTYRPKIDLAIIQFVCFGNRDLGSECESVVFHKLLRVQSDLLLRIVQQIIVYLSNFIKYTFIVHHKIATHYDV